AGERFVERVCSQDVVGETADDGDVLWSVVLAGARTVFVEDNVEGPMELVLDGPMGAADLRQPSWREHLRQSDVADGCLWLAVAGSSLRLDPADCLETWESGRVGKPIDCQDRCPSPFAASMRLLPGLEEGEIGCGSEAFLGGRIERPVVALEDQGILRFGGEHLPG